MTLQKAFIAGSLQHVNWQEVPLLILHVKAISGLRKSEQLA